MRTLRLLFAVVGLLTSGVAQDQATTLSTACDRADVIVIATVTAATDPSPQWHRLVFHTERVFAGQPGTSFTLLEPAGACCGRSLFALGIGERRLLFLRRIGSQLHPFGGSRGIIAVTPARAAHVQALLAARTAPARASLLAASLDHADVRIAHDAAHALASLPALQLGSQARGQVCRALQRAMARGQTVAASLLEVIVRCADAPTLDAVLPLYLRERHDDRAAMLRHGLQRLRPDLLTYRLPLHLNGDRNRQLRAAELLRQTDREHALPAMRALLQQTTCPRVKLCLTEGLLMAGAEAAALRRQVPAPIFDLARRRLDRPQLRTIRSNRR